MLKSFIDLIVSDNADEIIPSVDALTPNLFLCVLCEEGAFQFSIENEKYQVEKGDLVVCTPHNIAGPYLRTPDFQAKIICAGERLFDNALTGILDLDPRWWEKMLYLRQNPVIHLSEYQIRVYMAYFNLLSIHMEDSENPYRQRIIRLTAQSMAVEVLQEMNGKITNTAWPGNEKAESSQKDRLFQRFVSLLNRSDNTEREVKGYAEQLLVSPKYLSTVCKEKSGRTALELITEATIRNIRYYLMHTDLTIKEIAYKMDFPDVSFFCKYTKKHLGMTPLEYRKKVS